MPLRKITRHDNRIVKDFLGTGQAKPDTRINTDKSFHFSSKGVPFFETSFRQRRMVVIPQSGFNRIEA